MTNHQNVHRGTVIVLILGVAVLLFLYNWNATSSSLHWSDPAVLISLWTSHFQAFLYLLVAFLIWWYAHLRRAAVLYLLFSCCAAWTFLFQTSASTLNPLAKVASSSLSVFACLFLGLLVLIFPKEQNKKRLVQCLMTIFACIVSFIPIFYSFWVLPPFILNILWVIYYSYFLLVLLTICFCLAVASRGSRRALQTTRIFLLGALCALLPFVIFTVVPSLFLANAIIDGHWSTLSFVLLPLALGYSILRYQLLIADRYIRRTARSLVFLLFFITVASFHVILIQLQMIPDIWSIFSLTILALLAWKWTSSVTDILFFPEFFLFRKQLHNFQKKLQEETYTLNELISIFLLDCVDIFESSSLCFFVWRADCKQFRLVSPSFTPSGQFPTRLEEHMRAFALEMKAVLSDERGQGILTSSPLLKHLSSTGAPCIFSWQQEGGGYLMKYGKDAGQMFAREHPMGKRALALPITSGDQIIALLFIGETKGQTLAGPDLDRAAELARDFLPFFEMAQLVDLHNQRIRLLSDLFEGSSLIHQQGETIEELSRRYASICAKAMNARVDIFLADAFRTGNRQKTIPRDPLELICTVGEGPQLVGSCLLLSQRDWIPIFHDSLLDEAPANEELILPSCLPTVERMAAFAWLPLRFQNEYAGILLITYPGPHSFLRSSPNNNQEETFLLLFADHCAAALGNVRTKILLTHLECLQKEQEQQREQEKDRFLERAAKELVNEVSSMKAILGQIKNISSSRERVPVLQEAMNQFPKLSKTVDSLLTSRVEGQSKSFDEEGDISPFRRR